MDELEVVGVYRVPGEAGVHLVEVIVQEIPDAFDVGGFTQELPEKPEEEWPVPHDEHYLNEAGDQVVGDAFEEPPATETTRMAFFFHGLDFSKPLITPFGMAELPPATPMPARLAAIIEYEPPEEM